MKNDAERRLDLLKCIAKLEKRVKQLEEYVDEFDVVIARVERELEERIDRVKDDLRDDMREFVRSDELS